MPKILAPSDVLPRRHLIDVITGEKPLDMAITGGKLINVLTREVYPTDIGISGGRVALMGDIARYISNLTQRLDVTGKYLAPGLINADLHSYHCYLSMPQFAKAMLVRGTTTTVEGFYQQAMISGMRAIKFTMDEVRRTPLKIIFIAPCAAYDQNRIRGLPPTPNGLTEQEYREMVGWDECWGLEEPYAIPTYLKNPVDLAVFEKTADTGRVIQGHFVSGSGADSVADKEQLLAYLASGSIVSNHECVRVEEAIEQARLGMRIFIRMGVSWGEDVTELLKAIIEYKLSSRYFGFVTGAIPPDRLDQGGMAQIVRAAIGVGLDPITAIQMATVNIAEAFRADHEVGNIAIGRIADILVLNRLNSFDIDMVIANGRLVARGGELQIDIPQPKYPRWMYETVNLKRPVEAMDFEIRVKGQSGKATARVIDYSQNRIGTGELLAELDVRNGVVQPDLDKDILKIALVDRFGKEGVTNAFLHGLGIKEGAYGLSVYPIVSQLIICGTNSRDMEVVANRIAKMGGGIVAARNGKVASEVALPLFGLLSDEPLERFLSNLENVTKEVHEMGLKRDRAINTLEWITLVQEEPGLRFCSEGLFNMTRGELVDIIVREGG